MRYSRQQHLTAYASLLGALFIACIGQANAVVPANVLQEAWRTSIGAVSVLDHQENLPDTPVYRIAARLQLRLRRIGVQTPSVHTIAKAVTERQDLLKKHVTLEITQPDGTVAHEWQVSLQRYPLWLRGEFGMNKATFTIEEDRIAKTLDDEVRQFIVSPVNANIQEIIPKKGVIKVTADVAKSGQEIDIASTALQIKTDLLQGVENDTITLRQVDGVVTNATGVDLGEMKLLATGRSNFKGSTWNRSFNVRKALREHVNNTLVAPGEVFSFNSTLEGPVSQGNGWAMAKIIVNGADLEMAPGGGICQASTTTYRAALNAGFPVTQRKAHSLYVTYYKEYGVGIDATIFPGSQDLVFTNDTGNYILLQAYDDGYDAYVNIYGTPDGRSVALEGPYFTVNAPDDLQINGRAITQNEIAWLHTVWYPDGREVQSTVVSRYKVLPSYVRNEYAYAQ